MSSVDNRIVQMQFENEQFESGVKSTMSLLDRFKAALNFGDSAKGFEELQNASKKVDLGGMASAIQNISDKFTLMGQVGFQAMQRIASSVANAGINLAKSLSIDQIGAGMQKYEEETNAVQTMYYALKESGTTLEDVYGTLDKVAEYADQTSYSYTQMTNSMSQFITAGVDMNKAEIAVEGIANAAAKAGIGISNTAILFRNFSDAMSKGQMSLNDYKSLQLGKFDTRDFRAQVIEVAKAVGTLDKEGHVVDKATGKVNKKAQVSVDNFTEMLRYGFMNTDVMIETLSKYADTTTEFGLEAFHAAQQAKTFSDVMDSLKDVIGTGWKESFRYIFGDLEEAIDFFSWMADSVIDATSIFATVRNQILSDWKDAGGRDDLVEGIKAWFGDFTSIGKEIMDGIFEGMGLSKGWGGVTWAGAKSDWLVNLTKQFRKAGESFAEWLAKPAESWTGDSIQTNLSNIGRIAMGMGSIGDIITQVLGGIGTFAKEIFTNLGPSISAALDWMGNLGQMMKSLSDRFKRNKTFQKLGKKLAAIFTPLTKRLPNLIKNLSKMTSDFWIFLQTDPNIQRITKSLKGMFDAVLDFAPQAIEGLIEWTLGAIETVKQSDEWKFIEQNFKKYILPVWEGFTDFLEVFGGDVSEFFTMNVDSSLTWWEQLKKRFTAFDDTKTWLSNKWEDLKKDYKIFQEIEDWWNSSQFVADVKEWLNEFNKAFDAFMSEDTSGESSLIGKLKARFTALFDVLGPFVQEKWDTLKTKYTWLQNAEDLFTTISNLMSTINGSESEEATEGAEQSSTFMDSVQTLFGKISEMTSKISLGDVLTLATTTAAVIRVFKLLKTFATVGDIVDSVKSVFENVAGTIESIYKRVKASKMETKSRTLLMIAGSIALLAWTLKTVSSLEWDEIGRGLAGMAGLFVEEGAFMVIMEKLSGKGLNINEVNAGTIIGISTAILILGWALKAIGSMEWDDITRGLAGMAGLFAEEGAFMAIMGFFSSDWAAAKGMKLDVNAVNAGKMVGIAIALTILGGTLKSLGSMEWDNIIAGLGSMAGLFAETGAFMAIMGFFGGKKNIDMKAVSATKVIGIAIAIKMLGNTLKSLGEMEWGDIVEGLGGMAGLFLEQGAFMAIMGFFSSKKIKVNAVNPISMLGITGGIKMLAGTLKDLSEMGWDKIGPALGEMAILFGETGAFSIIMGFFNKTYNLNMSSVSLVTGALSAGMGMLADAVSKLAGYDFLTEILPALGALALVMVELGAFLFILGTINKLPNVDFKISISAALSIGILAGAIWVIAQSLIPLAQMNFFSMLGAIVGMGLIMAAIFVFAAATSSLKFNISGAVQGVVAAITIAGVMVAFGFVMKMVSDISPLTMIAFALAIDLITAAIIGMAALVTALQAVPMSGLLLGITKVGLISTLVGLVVAALSGIAGNAVSNLSDDIAHVGSELGLFSEMVVGIDGDAISAAVESMKTISAGLVEIGAKSYGSIDTFRMEMTRLGGALVLFQWGSASADPEKMKTKVQAIVDMATSLAGIPEIGDVSTSIGKIGGAVKLYSDSFKDVDTTNLPAPPDATAINGIFTSLSNSIPDQGIIDSFLPFADQGKADSLTDFAIGIENVGTAVAAYSKSCEGLEFGNMEKANGVLTALSTLETGTVTTASVTSGLGLFGGFAAEVKTQTNSLSTFADDVVILGGALESYATSCGTIDTDKMDKATEVVGKIADINAKLPKTGGLSTVLTGEQSLEHFSGNIKLLGQGAADFFDSIKDTPIDTGKVTSAVDALIKIADIQAKLPQLGGIGTWFTGDENLGTFSEGLPKLGTALNSFLTNFGDPTLSANLDTAIKQLDAIADIQVKLSSKESFYHLNDFATQIDGMAANLKSANTKLNEITWYTGGVDDISKSAFGQILNFATDMQVRLGDTVFSKSLKTLGGELKDFINNVSGAKYNETKMKAIVPDIESLFTSITKVFDSFKEKAETGETSISAIIDTMILGVTTGSVTWNEQLSAVGTDMVTNLETGMQTKADTGTAASIFASIGAACAEAAKDKVGSMVSAGANLASGLARGLSVGSYIAIQAAANVATRIKNTINSIFKIESPSRVMMETGMFLDLGLASGIDSYSAAPLDAASSLSNGILSTMNNLSKMNLNSMDITPTVRPVLDMTEANGNAKMLDGLMTGRLSARVTGIDTRAATLAAQQVAGGQGASVDLLTQIRDELITTRDRLDSLQEEMSNMQMVLDSGALVGAMAPSMDQQLGAIARRRRR